MTTAWCVNRYYQDYGQFHLLAREGDVTIPRVTPRTAQDPEHPLPRGRQQGRANRSDGSLALGVLRTLEAITASMRAGGASVCVA